jgi:hypothetical protein
VVGLVAAGGKDVSLEQYVRLVYPRFTLRGVGALDFTLEAGASARLAGFDAARTQVLDVTDPDAPFRVAITDASGAPAVLADRGRDAAPDRVSAGGRRCSGVGHPQPAQQLVGVGGGRPSWCWVPRHSSMRFRPLVDRRQSEGLTVALVDIEDVQDEFAGGEKSVDAVRSFLSRALTAWQRPPRYLLLLGAASYDPRDYLGLGGDLVPSAVVQTSEIEGVSDSWFVSEARSLSVGRLPVRTVAETQAVVAKILGRREATAQSPWLLVSDARGTTDFPAMNAELRSALPVRRRRCWSAGATPTTSCTSAFSTRPGPARRWSTSPGTPPSCFWTESVPPIYAVEDVAALAGSQASLWMHLTCFTGVFQDPRRQSLAVATLLTPSGGAWGTWASTASTYPAEHLTLNQALVEGGPRRREGRSVRRLGTPWHRRMIRRCSRPSSCSATRAPARWRHRRS